MTPDQATALRAPFPPEKIGKLPRVSCGACRESRDRSCDKHVKSRCGECGSGITSAHIHLDFVGHADATDRFLEVDPDWTWEPMALDARGLPAFDEDNGGLWIRLSIAGVTRIGYGDADGKRGANAVKEAIGDALRNAGLRFGVALDLWRKEPPVDEGARARYRKDTNVDVSEPPPAVEPTQEQTERYDELAKAMAAAETDLALRGAWADIVAAHGAGEISEEQGRALRADLDVRRSEVAGVP